MPFLTLYQCVNSVLNRYLFIGLVLQEDIGAVAGDQLLSVQ